MDVNEAFGSWYNGIITKFEWNQIRIDYEIYKCMMDKFLLKKEIIIIAAMSHNGVIGKEGTIPWILPDDMKFFAKITTNHTVIMGSKTWYSIPKKYRPLPNRRNIIISRSTIHKSEDINGADIYNNIEEAINNSTGKIFIIGGAEIYKLAMPYTDKYILTILDAMVEGDVKFPCSHQELKKISPIVVHPVDEKHKYQYQYDVAVYVAPTYELNEYFEN